LHNLSKEEKKQKHTPAPPEALTAQQYRFCLEYLKDYNGTKAATRAGYSPDSAASQASRLLKHEKINAELKKIERQAASFAAITPESVLTGIKQITDKAAKLGEHYNPQAALRGYELQGKALGMFSESGNQGDTVINIVTGLSKLSKQIEEHQSNQGVTLDHA